MKNDEKLKRKVVIPHNETFFAVFILLKDNRLILYNEKHIFKCEDEAKRDVEQLKNIHNMLGEPNVNLVIRQVVILEKNIENLE